VLESSRNWVWISQNQVRWLPSFSLVSVQDALVGFAIMLNNKKRKVPHKAVAEVSKIGNYRRGWLL